jgi:hypothetical protein
MEVIIFCKYGFVEIKNMKKVKLLRTGLVYCVYGRKVIVFTNLKKLLLNFNVDIAILLQFNCSMFYKYIPDSQYF